MTQAQLTFNTGRHEPGTPPPFTFSHLEEPDITYILDLASHAFEGQSVAYRSAGWLPLAPTEGFEARLSQIGLLPDPCDVESIVTRLGIEDLQKFACAVTNIVVSAARTGVLDPYSIRQVNSWFGSMEETVAAGEAVDEILGRRDDHEAYETV